MHARTSITAAIIALALIFGAVTAASAHTVAHSSTVTPAQAACTAFARWEQHQDMTRLGRLVVASTRLGRSYLKADIGQLYADASSPSAKSRKYVSDDAQYVFQDCHDGYGL